MAMTFNGRMTLFGDETPKSPIYKHESHKLHQAASFVVTPTTPILQATPCLINTTGDWVPFAAGNELSDIIGYAFTNSEYPAYGESRQASYEVTIVASGYMVIYGVADEDLDAGWCEPTGGYSTDGNYHLYQQMTSTDPADKRICCLVPCSAGELTTFLVK